MLRKKRKKGNTEIEECKMNPCLPLRNKLKGSKKSKERHKKIRLMKGKEQYR